MPVDPRAFQEFEQSGWKQAAAHYADSFSGLTSKAIEPLLDAARVTRGTRLLDVATGPGHLAAAAAARGADVVGIDFSPEMLEEARRRHPGLAFRQGDAQALTEPDSSADAVVISFGLMHLGAPERAIAEAHRVLADGGRFAFSAWTPPDQAMGFGLLLEATRVHGRPVSLPEGPPFFRFGDPDECRRVLAAFTEVEVRRVPLVWRFRTPDELFPSVYHGTVRMGAQLRGQPPEVLPAIRAAAAAGVAKYADGDGYAVPMPILVAAGTR